MANGIIQVPPDSTGKKVDAASLDVGTDSVIRQRVIIGDNSATAQFATITGGALLVQPNAVAISGTVVAVITTALPAIAVSGTATVVIGPSSSPISLTGTATVVIGQGVSNIGGVSLVAGTANIGFINNISATVVTAWASPQIVDKISATVTTILNGVLDSVDNNQVRYGDSANKALRVNIVAGSASGVSQVDDTTFSAAAAPFAPIGGVFADSGTGMSLSASHAGAVRITGFRAFHTNLRTDGGVKMEDSANQALRVNVVAGSANGVSQIDDTTFSAAAAAFVPIGGVWADTGTGQSLSASHAGAIRMTGFRAMHVNLRSNNGNEITASNPLSVFVERQSATVNCVVGAGTANIGFINNISATVNVAVGAGTNNIGGVSLVAGTANIGFINNISATVIVALANFIDSSGNNRNVVDSVNLALRANIVAQTGVQTDDTTFSTGAATFVPIGAVWSDSGTGQSLSASHAGALRMTGFRAMHVNVRNANGSENAAGAPLYVNIAGFTDNSGTSKALIDSANIALRVAGYGTLGGLPITGFVDGSGQNRILVDSANLALRVTLANATATAVVAYASPPTINNISATVIVTTANPWLVNIPSVSHGPVMLQRSTSATATLITAPGAGNHIYVTALQVSNAGTVLTSAQVGWSGSPQLVTMVCAANGGGFVMNFDPPWKVASNEAVICRVDPNSSGNVYFNVNFFVST